MLNIELNKMSGAELMQLKELIDKEMQNQYDNIDNFMYHDSVDEYLYVWSRTDGTTGVDCIGERAYKRFMNDPLAYEIGRQTKNLFPTYETLIVKEQYAKKGLRPILPKNTVQKNRCVA